MHKSRGREICSGDESAATTWTCRRSRARSRAHRSARRAGTVHDELILEAQVPRACDSIRRSFVMRSVIPTLTLVMFAVFGSGQAMADDSDWWSLVRQDAREACSTPSKEKPSGANFVIAGVDLRHGQPIYDAERKV